jgi:hypothetical protein
MYLIVERNIVATPLWDECEDETHTPKSGKLESSGTPENSELDCRGQNTSHWGVLDVIRKASHEPFEHLQPKLWAKEGSRVKLTI